MPDFGYNINSRNSPEEIRQMGKEFLGGGLFNAIEITPIPPCAADYDPAPYYGAIGEIVEKYRPRVMLHAPGHDIAAKIKPLRDIYLEEIERSVLELRALGGKDIVVHSGYVVGDGKYFALNPADLTLRTREDFLKISWELSVNAMKRICAFAARWGLAVYAENLAADPLTPDAASLIRYVRDIGCENLKIVFDVGHAKQLDCSIPEEIKSLGGNLLRHLHIHDTHTGQDEHLPLGGGTIDFREFASALAEIDYRGVYLFEIRHCHREELARSREVLEACIDKAKK
jgi:sugar phosphate isomerase/epimerase